LLHPETSAQVVLPDGKVREVPLDATANEFVFGETHRQGAYRLRIGTNELVFCVNLLDAAESDNRPRDELRLGQFERVTATTLQRANLEVWRSILALGLFILRTEWWYYHRRTV
jgi:hypothetical protein